MGPEFVAGQRVRTIEDFTMPDGTKRPRGQWAEVVAAEPPPDASDVYPEEWVLWVSFAPGKVSQDDDPGDVCWCYGTSVTTLP